MKAAVFESFGEPSEVLHVRDVPDPHPGPGEVRVRMILSPVNPSDLLVVRGSLRRPARRCRRRRASKGSASSTKSGRVCSGRFVKGKRVVVINSAGGQLGRVRRHSRAAGPARPGRHPRRAGRHLFRQPGHRAGDGPARPGRPKGEWLLQSAAGSTLGRMMINLGRHDGFKTLNVVRRREAIDELKTLGGDAVISSVGRADRRTSAPDHRRRGRSLRRRPRRRRDRAPASFDRSAPNGRLLLYGTLSGEPIQVDPRLVISGQRVVEGFWLGHWMRATLHPRGPSPVPRNRRADPPGRPPLGDRPDLSA